MFDIIEGQKFSTNPNKTMMLGLGFCFDMKLTSLLISILFLMSGGCLFSNQKFSQVPQTKEAIK